MRYFAHSRREIDPKDGVKRIIFSKFHHLGALLFVSHVKKLGDEHFKSGNLKLFYCLPNVCVLSSVFENVGVHLSVYKINFPIYTL